MLDVVSALASALTPIALSALTLWVALYGWAVLRNEVAETVPTFLWKLFKLGLVFALALQAAFYVSTVSDAANALATGVAATFLPATASPGTVSSPYALLDAFNDQAGLLVADLLKEAGITRLDLLFAAVVCAIGNVLFLCVALFVVTLSKLFLTFVIAIGPLFIFSLAWRPTQRFFDSWLSMALNAVVLTWFAFFALGISVYLGQSIVQAVQAQGGFHGTAFNVVIESLKYCIVMVLMAVICFQAPSLASALTGGAAVQQGVQLVQNVLMMAGLRSVVARSTVAANAAGAGGAIRRSLMGGGTASRGAPPSGAAPRTPAYRMAALRGRS